MKTFEPTHLWIVGSTKTPVVLNGGEVFDERTWTMQSHGCGVAQYECADYDADGQEILSVRVNDALSGRLVAVQK